MFLKINKRPHPLSNQVKKPEILVSALGAYSNFYGI